MRHRPHRWTIAGLACGLLVAAALCWLWPALLTAAIPAGQPGPDIARALSTQAAALAAALATGALCALLLGWLAPALLLARQAREAILALDARLRRSDARLASLDSVIDSPWLRAALGLGLSPRAGSPGLARLAIDSVRPERLLTGDLSGWLFARLPTLLLAVSALAAGGVLYAGLARDGLPATDTFGVVTRPVLQASAQGLFVLLAGAAAALLQWALYRLGYELAAAPLNRLLDRLGQHQRALQRDHGGAETGSEVLEGEPRAASELALLGHIDMLVERLSAGVAPATAAADFPVAQLAAALGQQQQALMTTLDANVRRWLSQLADDQSAQLRQWGEQLEQTLARQGDTSQRTVEMVRETVEGAANGALELAGVLNRQLDQTGQMLTLLATRVPAEPAADLSGLQLATERLGQLLDTARATMEPLADIARHLQELATLAQQPPLELVEPLEPAQAPPQGPPRDPRTAQRVTRAIRELQKMARELPAEL